MRFENTPAPTDVNDVLWQRVSEIRDSVRGHELLLVEAFGRSGKNGIVGRLGCDLRMVSKQLKAVQRYQLKIVLYALGGAGAGGGLLQGILHWLGG